jgi:3-polyprenyl-4-hydroxybenzoate decarboxylase
MNSIAFRLAGQLGIDATKKLPGEGFKRPWPPLIKMDEAVKAKVEKIMANQNASRIQAASPQ